MLCIPTKNDAGPARKRAEMPKDVDYSLPYEPENNFNFNVDPADSLADAEEQRVEKLIREARWRQNLRGLFCPIMLVLIYAGASLTLYILLTFARHGNATVPEDPNYADPNSWIALPTRNDGADIVPTWCGEDRQSEAEVDTFFVYPTSFISSTANNADVRDVQANLLTAAGSLTQHASAYNAASRVYSPIYRQASQAIQSTQTNSSMSDALRKSMKIARNDVLAAFDHYVNTWNNGRPIIIAGHSQGSLHASHLVKHLFANHAVLSKKLVAAYLIGNTVVADELPAPICEMATQTGCLVSWNSIEVGGTGGTHWSDKITVQVGLGFQRYQNGTGVKPLCVNPITWMYDSKIAIKEEHTGAMPVTGHLLLPSFHTKLLSAQCGVDGILYVSKPEGHLGYFSEMTFKGKEYHAFDYSFFYPSIRNNVRSRVHSYLINNFTVSTTVPAWLIGEEKCPPCFQSVLCIFGMMWHVIVGLVLLYVVSLALMSPVYTAIFYIWWWQTIGKQNSLKKFPPCKQVVGCVTCSICYCLWRRGRQKKSGWLYCCQKKDVRVSGDFSFPANTSKEGDGGTNAMI